MRYVQCKKCKKVYHGSLKRCPECETKTPPSTTMIVAGIILIIFGVVFLMSAAVNWNDESAVSSAPINASIISNAEESLSTQVEDKGKVNYENFEKIQNGMTYQQVVEIFGEEGKVMSETDAGLGEEYKTVVYYWYDETDMANCNIMTQGNKVISKSQIGLR